MVSDMAMQKMAQKNKEKPWLPMEDLADVYLPRICGADLILGKGYERDPNFTLNRVQRL